MIQGIDIVKIYKSEKSGQHIAALRGCDFHVKEGEFISVIGPSGAGKSTLLRLLGALEKPSSGEIWIDHESLSNKSTGQLREIRRTKIGFISQSAEDNLIHGLSVRKNLEFAMRIKRLPKEAVRERSKFLLRAFNLEAMQERNVAFISGGELLRTAVAAALAKQPTIILADEPTGRLDSPKTVAIRRLLREISRDSGVSIVVATHDPRFRIEVDRSITISDGRLVREETESPMMMRHEQQIQFKAYIDSTGFIQIPQGIRDHLGLKKSVLIELDSSGAFAVLRPSEKAVTQYVQIGLSIGTTTTAFRSTLDKERSLLASLTRVSMIYESKGYKIEALRNIDLDIFQGEFVALVGPSGSGKTTLMRILAGLMKPTSGIVRLDDQFLMDLSGSTRAGIRARKIGIVAEETNLHPSLTILDNITLPFILQDRTPNIERAIGMLKACEIADRIESYPNQLSEGEKQRAALIAALIHVPSMVLMDEPTSHLESTLAIKMIDLIVSEAKHSKTAVVLATHDLALLRPGFRMVTLDSGEKVSDQIVDEQKHKRLIEEFYGIGMPMN